MSAALDDFETIAGELATAGQLPQPGTWRSALYRDDAPGAELDGQPWARSWPRFMRAITDPMDAEPRRFIAAVMTRPKNATFTERIPSEGGFLVPEYLRSQVMEYMTAAVMRPRAMVLPMGSLRLAVPNLDNPTQQSGTQALGGLEFSFVEPGSAIPATAPTFGRTVLEANKFAGLLQNTPNELVEDAAGPLGDFFARVVPEGMAWAEDDLFIGNGTGVGQPQSLIDAPCAVTVTRNASDAVLLPDIVAMFKALHPAAKQAGLTAGVTGVAWLLSAEVLDQLLELYLYPAAPTDPAPGTGAVATLSDWFQAGDGNQVGPSLLGLPALITDHQPALGSTGDAMLVDLRQYLIADRLTMTIEKSPKGPGFGSDTSDFRIKSRLDGRYWIQSPTTTEAAQVVSPVVVLGAYEA